MFSIGYHASHEQFPPSALLSFTLLAQQAGFGAAMCSDHFAPWSKRQKESGYAFAWLGAALQASSLSVGSVCAPGYRHHPAVVAQMLATLAEMFPERFWVALGSGEFLNEQITGKPWPSKPERNRTLQECIEVIRALLAGETITYRGEFIDVAQAKLYTHPSKLPPLFGTALSPQTAQWVGQWGDGLLMATAGKEKMKSLIEAFRRGGGEKKPVFIQAKLSYAKTEEQALENAFDQWRNCIFESSILSDLRYPEQFDALGEFVHKEQMRDYVHISSDLDFHIEWLEEYFEMGFERIYLHNVGRNQQEFIEAFAERVIPFFLEKSQSKPNQIPFNF